MSNYNTFQRAIYTAKRSIFNFASKIGEGMQKSNKDFILDIFYGLAKGKSVLLSNIARALEEPIDTIQTVKRLSTRLEDFHEEDKLVENYEKIIRSHLKEDNLILVDTSEIIKPNAYKMEALGRVRDGSTGKIENGYWTTSMIAVAPKTKHPVKKKPAFFVSK